MNLQNINKLKVIIKKLINPILGREPTAYKDISVMVIVVGNGHGDMSSNPGRDWLYFT